MVVTRFLAIFGFMLAGCEGRKAMNDQPKALPMAESTFFPDGASSRPLIPGTVPRGGPLKQYAKASEVTAPRPPISRELLDRGRQRYDIFCSMCHGRDGYGGGMVVQRGFPQAASYHTDRLRGAEDDHIFAVITDGYRNCPANGPLILPPDRWAIVAYVRALQLSQNARIEDVPDEERSMLGG